VPGGELAATGAGEAQLGLALTGDSLYNTAAMYLFRTGTPRRTKRNRCARHKAKLKAKNRRRRQRLQK
jgi:hypothetical protein